MSTTLNLGELQVRLSASTAGFDAQFRSAQQVVSSATAQMQRGLNDLERTTSGLIVPAGSLTGKLEVFSGTANKAGASVDKMGKHMHGAQQQAEGLVGTLSGMEAQMNLMMGGTALSATLTAPLVLFAKSALEASIGFEDAFAGVRKTVDATEQEFGQIEERFRSMAKTTPITANEFARIGELAGQLGVRGVDNLTGFTDVVAKIGVTTNLATDEAATSLARFANIMQMPLEQADRLGSTIVDLGNNLATTEQEITQFALRISGAGKQVGLSEAQVLGFGAALSSVGINAEAGGTAISRVFAKLAVVVGKGGDDLKMFANVAGVSAQDFAKAFKEDAANATIMFIEGLKRIQDSGGNVFTVLEKLELEDIRVRDALLRTAGAGDVLRKSIDLASKAWESNTALNVEAAKRFDTTASRLQIMQNNFVELGRRIADTFAPAINGVIGAFNDLFESLQNMPPLLQGLLVGVSALAAALGPLMLGLAGFGAVSAGIKAALPVLGMLWAAITGPAGLATVAIAGLIVGIGTFAAASKKAREETAKKQESLIKLSDQYETLTRIMEDGTKTDKERTEAEEEQRKVMMAVGELFPDLVTQWDEHSNAVAINTKALRENAQTARDSQKAQAEAAITKAQDMVNRLGNELEQMQKQRENMLNPSGALAVGLGMAGQRGYKTDVSTAAVDKVISDRIRDLQSARNELSAAWKAFYDITNAPSGLRLYPDNPEAPAIVKGGGDKNNIEEEETGKRDKYLEEFETRFTRSQEDMREIFSRAQEDATEVFKGEQENRLLAFKTNQDQEKMAFESRQEAKKLAFQRTLDDERDALNKSQQDRLSRFQTVLEDEKIAFERALDDRKIMFDRAQDREKERFQRQQQDLLFAFQKRQDAEMDALQTRQDAERAMLDANFDKQYKDLKAKQDAIRAAEEQAEQAERLADLNQKIAAAQDAVSEAYRKGDMKDIADAKRRVTEAIGNRDAFLRREANKIATDRIQDQIDALREETDQKKNALKVQQDAETEALKELQEKRLADYRRQLEDQKIAFDERLAEAKVQYERALADQREVGQRNRELRLGDFKVALEDEKKRFDDQKAERKRQFDEELDDQKRSFENKQNEQERYFKHSLEFELKEWKRTQDDRITRYKRELDDLHDSFSDKLAEQQKFLQTWNAMAAQMSALVPGAGGELKLPDFNPALPGGGSGGGGGRIFAMAQGGILKKPIFAAGEAGPEIVAPLSKLDDLMAPMLNRVLDYIGGIGRSAVGGDMQPVMAGVGSVTNNLRVFIGNRELYEVIVEANEDARKRGRS